MGRYTIAPPSDEKIDAAIQWITRNKAYQRHDPRMAEVAAALIGGSGASSDHPSWDPPFDARTDAHRRCVAVALMLGSPHNWPLVGSALEGIEFYGGGMLMYLRHGQSMSTFDDSMMTKLVLMGHLHQVRVEVAPWSIYAADQDSSDDMSKREWRMIRDARRMMIRELGYQPSSKREWRMIRDARRMMIRELGYQPSSVWPITITGLRLNFTARDPEGTSLFDRHPSLDHLREMIESLQEPADGRSD